MDQKVNKCVGKGNGENHSNWERKFKSLPLIVDYEEFVKFGRKIANDDMNSWDLRAVCVAMLTAQIDNREDVIEKCLDRLMTDSQTRSAITNCINRNYTRYGIDELRKIYDSISYDDVHCAIEAATRNIWKYQMKPEPLLRWCDGTIPYQQGRFVNTFLSCRLKDAYKQYTLSIAKEFYPTLSYGSLKLYIKIRKESKYMITLSTETTSSLDTFCLNHDIKATWGQIVAMQKSFGYETEEDKVAIARHEQAVWNATHRSEILFWKQTDANNITEDELEDTLLLIRDKMQYDDAEIACLRNWVNTARYEGRAISSFACMPVTFDKRYRIRKSDSDIVISKRVRKDIINVLGSDLNRVTKTLSKNLGGKIIIP